MRNITIAEGHRAIEFAQADRNVRLHSPEQEDITELEALAIARENPALIFASIGHALAETSWENWQAALTDHFTVISKDDSPNVYLIEGEKITQVEARIPIEDNAAEIAKGLERGLAWSYKTRQPATAKGLTLSQWILSKMKEAM